MVDFSRVTAGLKGTAHLLVGPEHTAPFVGSGRIPVLATPVMITVIEAAPPTGFDHPPASDPQPLLHHLNASREAAAPAGLRVVPTAEALQTAGPAVTFSVEARDDFGVIGGGTYRR